MWSSSCLTISQKDRSIDGNPGRERERESMKYKAVFYRGENSIYLFMFVEISDINKSIINIECNKEFFSLKHSVDQSMDKDFS